MLTAICIHFVGWCCSSFKYINIPLFWPSIEYNIRPWQLYSVFDVVDSFSLCLEAKAGILTLWHLQPQASSVVRTKLRGFFHVCVPLKNWKLNIDLEKSETLNVSFNHNSRINVYLQCRHQTHVSLSWSRIYWHIYSDTVMHCGIIELVNKYGHWHLALSYLPGLI